MMKKTFTLIIGFWFVLIKSYTQPGPDTLNPQTGNDCYVGYSVEIMKSNPPLYRFIPSLPDSLANYWWDFGDGEYATDMFPIHSYKYSGSYSVCLFYTSEDSCTSYVCETIKIQGFDRTCEAFWQAYPVYYYDSTVADTLIEAEVLRYQFLDQSKGNIIAWKWEFGDGSGSTDKDPVHIYQQSGVYTISLEIQTEDSCSSIYTSEMYVGVPRECNLTGTVKDYTGLDGCGLVIVMDNGIVIEPAEMVSDFVLYDGQRVQLGYTELNDRFSVCMTGIIVRIDCIQELMADSCNASFTHYTLPYISSVPPVYQFEALYGGNQREILWDLGDGTTTTERSPVHRYPYDGYYTVCLTITNADGCIAQNCETFYFEGYEPQPGLCDYFIRLTTDIILNGNSCNGSAMASLVDASGNSVFASSYLWSSGETTPVIYNLCPGSEYSVILTDATNCAVSGSFYFGSPVAYPDSLIGYWNYQQDDMDFIFNLPVYSDSIQCEWDFGDGYTSQGRSVSHTYDSVDFYTVVLKVFDKNGNLLFNQDIMVSPGAPTGIREIQHQAPVIYPVPAYDWLFISLQDDEQAEKIEILNAGGQVIMISNVLNQNNREIELNVSGLPAGFFMGRIILVNGKMQTFRFVK